MIIKGLEANKTHFKTHKCNKIDVWMAWWKCLGNHIRDSGFNPQVEIKF